MRQSTLPVLRALTRVLSQLRVLSPPGVPLSLPVLGPTRATEPWWVDQVLVPAAEARRRRPACWV